MKFLCNNSCEIHLFQRSLKEKLSDLSMTCHDSRVTTPTWCARLRAAVRFVTFRGHRPSERTRRHAGPTPPLQQNGEHMWWARGPIASGAVELRVAIWWGRRAPYPIHRPPRRGDVTAAQPATYDRWVRGQLLFPHVKGSPQSPHQPSKSSALYVSFRIVPLCRRLVASPSAYSTYC